MTIKGVIAIDPGNIQSGFAILDENYKPLEFGKVENNELLQWFEVNRNWMPKEVCIERVSNYGMPSGETIFMTCEWIGRFTQYFDNIGIKVKFVKRKEYVTFLCGSSRAKDANVIQYLIDRFAPFTPNRGKGTKKEQGWFYGFKADVWQAYAIGVWALDVKKEKTPI